MDIVITDANIKELVKKYLNDPATLPLTLRDISTWDVSKVTNMKRLFYYPCQVLDVLDEIIMLCYGPGNASDIRFLKGVITDQKCLDLSCQRDHRH